METLDDLMPEVSVTTALLPTASARPRENVDLDFDWNKVRLDDQDPYRKLYRWLTGPFDARYLLTADKALDRDYLAPEDRKSLIDFLKSTVQTGVSALSYLGGVIDKPFAATRGLIGSVGALLTGNAQKAKESFSQILLLLPFSESYLRPLYNKVFQKLGLQVPQEHISGREVLELWGAPKNKPGWNLKTDLSDAIWDAAGLALEFVAAPPVLPRIGGLTKAGRLAYRLGPEAAQIAKAESVLASFERAVQQQPNLLTSLAQSQTLRHGLRQLGEALGVEQDALRFLDDAIAKIPAETAQQLHSTLRKAATQGDTQAAAAALRNLPERLTLHQALADQRQLPAVGWYGKAEELKTGTRGIILEPMWPWSALGVPRIELGGKAAGAALETSAKIAAPLRAALSWTVGDTILAQAGAERVRDTMLNLVAGTQNVLAKTKMWHASILDEIAKNHQLAILGDNQVGIRTFEELLYWVMEHRGKFHGTLEDRAAQIARHLVQGQPPPEGLIQSAKSALELSYQLADEIPNAFYRKLEELGVPIKPSQSLFTDRVARHTTTTPLHESGLLTPGVPILTARQMSKGAARKLALKDVPGGTVAINLMSRDPIVLAPTTSSNAYEGLLSAVDSHRRFWLVGDWVQVQPDVIGRIVRLTDTGEAVVRLPGTFSEQIRRLDELIPSGPPVNLLDHIPAPRLTQVQQTAAAEAWLRHHNIPVPSKKELPLPKSIRVLRQYLLERYLRPWMDRKLYPEQALLLVEPGPTLPNRSELRKQLQQLWPERSRRDINFLLRQVPKGGLSTTLLQYLRTVKHDRGIFDYDILENLSRNLSYQIDLISAMSGVHEQLRRAAFVGQPTAPPTLLSKATSWLLPEGVPLREAWQSLRIPRRQGRHPAPPTELGLQSLLKAIQETRPDLWQEATLRKVATGKDITELIMVPKSVLAETQRFLQILMPGTQERLWYEKVFRQFARWAATWLTVPRLAFHGRNILSDAMRVAMADGPYTPLEAFKTWRQVANAAFQGKWETLPYWDEINRLGVVGGGARLGDILMETPTAPTAATTIGTWAKQPAKPPMGLAGVGTSLLQDIAEHPWSLLSLSTAKNPFTRMGQNLFGMSEGIGRATAYILARQKGMQPGQAAEFVRRTLYDYSRLSGVEQRYLRPTIFFYGWLRQNLGYMLPKITFDWASLPARTLWGALRIQAQTTEPMPEWLRNNLGIPLPWRTENRETPVIRSLGLPLEDLAYINTNWAETWERLVARLHPGFKAAYMISTGKDPFTGLPLSEAKPMSEQIIATWKGRYPVAMRPPAHIIEQVLPFLSVIGFYTRLTEPKSLAPSEPVTAMLKLIDLFTGIKFGVYDLEKQTLNELLEQLKDELRRQPEVRVYERPYLKKEVAPSLKTQALLELYNALERRWREQQEAKARSTGTVLLTR